MGYKNRELETKLIVKDMDASYDDVKLAVERIFRDSIKKTLEERRPDIYWHPSKAGKASFARVRLLDDEGNGQMTIKCVDRGDNTDRVETDIKITDVPSAISFLTAILGRPAGKITKKYKVYWIEAIRDGDELDHVTNVSVYKVDGLDYTFIEIEAKTPAKLRRAVKKVCDNLPWRDSTYAVKSSLYDIFIKKVRMKLRPIADELESLKKISGRR